MTGMNICQSPQHTSTYIVPAQNVLVSNVNLIHLCNSSFKFNSKLFRIITFIQALPQLLYHSLSATTFTWPLMAFLVQFLWPYLTFMHSGYWSKFLNSLVVGPKFSYAENSLMDKSQVHSTWSIYLLAEWRQEWVNEWICPINSQLAVVVQQFQINLSSGCLFSPLYTNTHRHMILFSVKQNEFTWNALATDLC